MRRRLLPLLPAVLAALIAGLFIAHDATWSILVGIAVGIVAVVAAVAVANGRFGTVLAFAGAVVLAIATAAAVSGLWLGAVGRQETVTISHVRTHDGGKGVGRGDDYTRRRADGSEVAGPLRTFRPGSRHVGDRLEVVDDPTGLVRFPTLVGNPHHADDRVGGPLAMAAALGLLAFVRLSRGLPPPPGGPHLANIGVAELQQRLAAEERDPGGSGPPR